MAIEKKDITKKDEIPATDDYINTTQDQEKQQDEEENEKINPDTKQGEVTAKQENKELRKPAQN